MSDDDKSRPFSANALGREIPATDTQSMCDRSRREWLRLSAAMRRAAGSAVELDTDLDSLVSLADRAEELADHLESHAHGRGIPLFGPLSSEPGEPPNLGTMMPFSPIVGKFNPIAPGLEFHREGDRVISRARLGSSYQGAPGLVHGAVISAIYDELLAMSNLINGVPGPTAKLMVRYRKPTPLDTELRFEGWVERQQGRRVYTHGQCYAGDQLLTQAEGVFVLLEKYS